MRLIPVFSALAVAFVAIASHPALAEAPKVKLEKIYAGVAVERPVSIQIPPDGSKRRFLVEQTGRIKLLPPDEGGSEAAVYLDLTGSMQVEKDFEEGLLGLAFHPQFKENGRLYVTFSRQGPKRLVLAEYSVPDAAASSVDLSTERILLEVQEPEWNHNSGNVFFGPDGKLYLCSGDGGLKNGVHLLAQKLTSWCGKVLRIDVDTRSGTRPYGIPEDNPFVNMPNASPEIWAYGLRNPWGAAIDPATGLFYLADVGQDLYEEINLIEKGGNYGWNYREATHSFPGREALATALGQKADPPKDAVFIEPIHEYSRADGLSITGGFVYRGKAVPALQGRFIFGDWRFGNLWALHYDPAQGKVIDVAVLEKPDPANPTAQPTAFCPDENGEAFVLDWRGAIFRLVPAE